MLIYNKTLLDNKQEGIKCHNKCEWWLCGKRCDLIQSGSWMRSLQQKQPDSRLLCVCFVRDKKCFQKHFCQQRQSCWNGSKCLRGAGCSWLVKLSSGDSDIDKKQWWRQQRVVTGRVFLWAAVLSCVLWV